MTYIEIKDCIENNKPIHCVSYKYLNMARKILLKLALYYNEEESEQLYRLCLSKVEAINFYVDKKFTDIYV